MATNIMDRESEPECDSFREFVFRANSEEVNIMQYAVMFYHIAVIFKGFCFRIFRSDFLQKNNFLGPSLLRK